MDHNIAIFLKWENCLNPQVKANSQELDGKGGCSPAPCNTINLRLDNLQKRSKEGRREHTTNPSCANDAEADRGQHVFYLMVYIAPLLRLHFWEQNKSAVKAENLCCGSWVCLGNSKFGSRSKLSYKCPRTCILRFRFYSFLFMVKTKTKQKKLSMHLLPAGLGFLSYCKWG